MVHTKLHFYVNIFQVWSRLGGINFIWPKEHSMLSEFPWLQLTAAPVPCALDQAVVVHDPLHRWVSCFTVAFNDGRRCLCLRFWEHFIGYTVWEVDCIHLNGRILLYTIQGSLTDLRCRDKIVCSLIQCALQAMGPGATLCRTTVPLLTESESSQISCRPLPRFGSCHSLDNE